MWICTNKAFLSVVTDPGQTATLLVRARKRGHIESVFPDAQVIRRPGRDYLYRASVPRAEVAAAIAKQVAEISYPNFKNSVRDHELHDAYADVWSDMSKIQAVRPYGQDSAAARKREGITPGMVAGSIQEIKTRVPRAKQSKLFDGPDPAPL